MPRRERQKGKRGELELSKKLTEILGIPFRRTQQYCGSEGASDVTSEFMPGVHWECKRCEKLSLYKAMAQAIEDGKDSIPVVCHRRNGEDWLVVVRLSDLPGLAGTVVGVTL